MVNVARRRRPPGLVVPWTPPGRTVTVPGRGDVFLRWHQHEDATRPTVVLLHGWTSTGDLQFFTAYRQLGERYSLISVDHCGHGRGVRTPARFELEDVADDVAHVLRELGIRSAVAVGYSMGGPIALLLRQRHPELVSGLVVQATALSWNESRFERARWRTLKLLAPALRSWAYPRTLASGIRWVLGADSRLLPYVPWIVAEMRRNDPHAIEQAGRAIGRFDARPWAGGLGVAAASLVTSADRLVPPGRQRALAATLRAHVVELPLDHLAPWEDPDAYGAATLALIDHVSAR